jgi:hypothetical protein
MNSSGSQSGTLGPRQSSSKRQATGVSSWCPMKKPYIFGTAIPQSLASSFR